MPSKSPDAFRTISEVADWLNTPAHVLRFWESKFSQVKPVKRAGGRRYYRPADMTLLGGIKKLLHDDGMTIKGVQKILREQGIKHVSAMSQPLDEDLEMMIEPAPAAPPTPTPAPVETGQVLDFAGRSAAAQGTAPAAETPKDTGDLFGAEDKGAPAKTPDATPLRAETAEPPKPAAEDTPAPSEAAAPTPLRVDSSEPATEQPAAEALPDFVQKPLSERLAEDDPAAAPAPVPPSDNLPPAETPETATTQPEDAADPDPDPAPLTRALPDPAPEATTPAPTPDDRPAAAEAPEDPEPLAVTGAQAEPEDEPEPQPEPDPAILAAVLRASEQSESDEDEDDEAPRVQAIDTPPDPQDHEVSADPGLLTLLTVAKTRQAKLSAQQIEALIARVQSHAKAMNIAARN